MKKKYITISIIFILLLAVDLITKSTFVGADYVVIPHLFNFHYTQNTGAGFSILADKTWLLILLSVAMIIGIVLYDIFAKRKHPLYNVAFALILTGAIGNLIDRVFLGYVRDFVQFAFWQEFPIFNVADICLTFGVILFVIFVLFLDKNPSKDILLQQSKTKNKTINDEDKIIKKDDEDEWKFCLPWGRRKTRHIPI